ncbi:hypothetical protein N7508_000264 [Penicillium antarcticum]|uniref:uncharacterized protein n=1 Tax=Penicillium antarcticum TaxID=416450 RepID=UPI0023A03CE0|nr:uncharacterized protein N7508_000264 [Penicillium antarcticum]KAJ5319981.1 hypothetical protein N7508_000264 [Penicillium antarcticum]
MSEGGMGESKPAHAAPGTSISNLSVVYVGNSKGSFGYWRLWRENPGAGPMVAYSTPTNTGVSQEFSGMEDNIRRKTNLNLPILDYEAGTIVPTAV